MFSIRIRCAKKERMGVAVKTAKQRELIDAYLGGLQAGLAEQYRQIALCLADLGYYPRKQRSYIVFRHDLHNREMAKMGMAWTKDHTPYFSLRFSACKGYSERFAEIIRDYILKNPGRLFPHCQDDKCVFRQDGDRTPYYEYAFPSGETQSFCGAKALVIPDIRAEDLDEIKALIRQEHAYLVKHEA